MNKELTPLEALKTMNGYATGMTEYVDCDVEDCFKIIETALKDYELLIMTSNIIKNNIKDIPREDNTNKLKALEIIKKKRVDVNFFLRMLEEWGGLPYNTVGDDKKALQMYNECNEYKLTQEEFDLLKEVLK